MTEVSFSSAHGTHRGYLAEPAADGPWPGVVVIHDVFGITRDLRRQCEWLASSGYLAFAPDLFSTGSKLSCLRSIFLDLRTRRGRNFDEIDAARSWLLDNDRCSGRVGVIGYCMGGGFSLLLAPSGHYDVSSVNYGEVPKDAETFLATACPVVASYGARDRMLKGRAERLERALRANNIDHDVKEYPDAGHGFLNRHEGGPGVLVAVVGRLLGQGYDESAATDARRRIITFLDRYLKDDDLGGTPKE
ncbi:MAG: dienelactone hydrolase family protein [Acidimicrobiales bacterium]